MGKSYLEKDFEERLFNYYSLGKSIETLEEELELIENQLLSSGGNKNAYNFGGSDFNSVESKYSNLIANKIKKECLLKTNKFYYKHITNAFNNSLDKTEKFIIQEYFFKRNGVDEINVNYERAQVYRYINRGVSKMLWYIWANTN